MSVIEGKSKDFSQLIGLNLKVALNNTETL